jgi:hypothetical protein
MDKGIAIDAARVAIESVVGPKGWIEDPRD